MERIIQRILNWNTSYKSLIQITVFKDNLLHNLNEFQQIIGKNDKRIVPVLKSNAYGHGLVNTARILDPLHLPFFCVDSFFEALSLRKENIQSPILIIGYVYSETVIQNNLKNISFVVTNLDYLKEISTLTLKFNKKTKIHLKIDTGMHRQGIQKEEINESIKIISENSNLELEGICTHLADADGDTKTYTLEQIKEWNSAVSIFKNKFPSIKYVHGSASAGSLFVDQMEGNVFRLGIGLYGLGTGEELKKKVNLKPALEFRTIISGVKKIKKGEKVGYNGTFEAPKDMTIATIPAGYNEGIDRRLSNKGFVKINSGKFAPIIGRVSMNITTIDITDLPEVRAKDSVVVISSHKTDKNSVEEIARVCGTIPYEILIHVPGYLRRIVI
ncbi:MAG: alanine racemase [bacterium]|nr:alanine racemase [bacterium]